MIMLGLSLVLGVTSLRGPLRRSKRDAGPSFLH